MADIYAQISESVIEGAVETVKAAIQQVLASGAAAQTILDRGLVPGMEVVGQRFKEGEMFIPEVLLSARRKSDAEGFCMCHPNGSELVNLRRNL